MSKHFKNEFGHLPLRLEEKSGLKSQNTDFIVSASTNAHSSVISAIGIPPLSSSKRLFRGQHLDDTAIPDRTALTGGDQRSQFALQRRQIGNLTFNFS